MRVLLDSCVPQRLRFAIVGHQVVTAQFAQVDGLLDADLLDAAEGKFDVLVTCDQGLPWQQNMQGRGIAVALLVSRTNRLADLQPLVPQLLAVLQTIGRGEVCEIRS